MGTKDLIAVTCWLILGANCEQDRTVNSSLIDNVSAESVKHEFKIYASALPHATYKYQGRRNEPAAAQSGVLPVKEETLVLHKQNGFLKDSYGNKFLETPHKVAYKATLPQQFVRLQDLPLHLSEPLVEGKGFTFLGNPPKVAPVVFNSRAAGSSNAPHYNAHGSFPSVYAENVKRFPLKPESYSRYTSPQRQSSNHKAVYADKFNTGFYPHKMINKFERLQAKPRSNAPNVKQPNQRSLPPQSPVSASANQVIVTHDDGKKTIVILDSKPPVPLLDLSLLEPLHFDNPIVPQVQHFLPKIEYKIPQVEAKNHHDEFIVSKTKSYNSGDQSSKEDGDESERDGEYNNSNEQDDDSSAENNEDSYEDNDERPKPTKPTYNEQPRSKNHPPTKAVVVTKKVLKKPNLKETYNEQVVSYNKKTNSEPVHYSYDSKVQNKPVEYSYSKSTHEPVKSKSIAYESKNGGPMMITYYETPGSKENIQEESPRQTSQSHKEEEINNSSAEDDSSSEDDEAEVEHEYYPESSSKQSHELRPEHREQAPVFKPSEPKIQHYSLSSTRVPQNSPQHGEHKQEERNRKQEEPETFMVLQTFQPIKLPPQMPSISVSPQFYEEEISFLPTDQPLGPVNIEQEPQKQEVVVHEYYPQNQGPIQNAPQHLELKSQQENLQEDQNAHKQPHPRPLNALSEIISFPQLHNHGLGPKNNDFVPVQAHHSSGPEKHVEFGGSPLNVPPYHHHNAEQHTEFGPISQAEFVPSVNHISPHSQNLPQRTAQSHVSGPQNNQGPTPQHLGGAPKNDFASEHVNYNSDTEKQSEFRGSQLNGPTHHKNPEQHSSFGPSSVNDFIPVVNFDSSPKQNHPQREFNSRPQNEFNHENQEEHDPQSEKVIVQETPEENHLYREKMSAEVIKEQENNEADFEKSYKDAAYGFPEFERSSNLDTEEHVFEEAPFEQYQSEGDNFPKSSRLQYKDSRDDLKEDYYLDYAIKKPERLTDRHKSKYDYYKLFKNQRPQEHFNDEEKQEKKESSNYFAKYQNAPKFEYNYAEEAPSPKDSFPYASGPPRSTHNLFYEPHFQYAYEPAELSGMSSNLSPKRELPSTRNKMYKDNWYVMKTHTQNSPKS